MPQSKRINLCFNIDDDAQRLVYEYLSGVGRGKSDFVVSIVLDHLAGKEAKRKEQEELFERLERIARNIALDEAKTLRAETQELLQAVHETPIPIFVRDEPKVVVSVPAIEVATVAIQEETEPKMDDDIGVEDMSDEAFDAMMAMGF